MANFSTLVSNHNGYICKMQEADINCENCDVLKTKEELDSTTELNILAKHNHSSLCPKLMT